jgi:tetratricopeptide (TPR) repeat protein
VTSLEDTGETLLQTGSSKDDKVVSKSSNSTSVSKSPNTQLYPMVLLSIRVDSENLETQTWREWIRDVPTEATNITIQGIYRSCSTLLLLTMPIETWTLLPDNAAYSFVGFVTSSNLAPTLLSAAKSTTPAKEQFATASPEDVLKISSQLTALEDLALTKRDLGKLEEAEKLQERVLELRKRTGVEGGPNMLRAMRDLALTKRDLGKLEEAEKLQERELELRQRTGKEERSNVFENMSVDDSSSQIIVSTVGKLISAKSVTGGAGSMQIGGEISDDSIRQLLQSRYQVTGSKAAGLQTRSTQFEDRYGSEVNLSLESLNDADATA